MNVKSAIGYTSVSKKPSRVIGFFPTASISPKRTLTNALWLSGTGENALTYTGKYGNSYNLYGSPNEVNTTFGCLKISPLQNAFTFDQSHLSEPPLHSLHKTYIIPCYVSYLKSQSLSPEIYRDDRDRYSKDN